MQPDGLPPSQTSHFNRLGGACLVVCLHGWFSEECHCGWSAEHTLGWGVMVPA